MIWRWRFLFWIVYTLNHDGARMGKGNEHMHLGIMIEEMENIDIRYAGALDALVHI